jgi:hypothetical protein
LIDFSVPVTAFGFDFFPTILTGTEIGVTVFAADDTTILQSDTIIIPPFSFGSFIGLVEPADIGSVALTAVAAEFFKDINIDNVTFGLARVPEPASLLLFLAGFAAIARRLRGRP